MDVFQLAFTFWKASLISIVERLLQSKLAGRFGSEADIITATTPIATAFKSSAMGL
jgi:hypothetical protein